MIRSRLSVCAPPALDALGGVLVVALVGWTAVAGGAPRGVAAVAGIMLASVAAFVVSRIAGRFGRWQVPLLITVGALAVAVLWRDVLLDVLTGPLGYANATAAFFVLAAAAAVMVALEAPLRPLRPMAAALAVLFATVPWLNRSGAGMLLTLLLPLALLAGRTPRGTRMFLNGGLAATLLVVAGTVALSWDYDENDRDAFVDRVADATVQERRVALWHDAVVLVWERPLTGTGTGGYRELSPTALEHPRTERAHSAYLQIAAETGLPGVFLLLTLVAWGFARLQAVPPGQGTAVAGAALTSAAAHAGMDHVWDFPAVVLVAAALLGVGTARSARAQR